MSEDLIVDNTRSVVRNGTAVAADRALPTFIWTPVGTGPFPLVIFVHGDDVGPLTYQRFCSNLASSGYVVAAPSFPLEDPTRPFGLDRGDLPNEATDVSFVITDLERGSTAKTIDSSRIAVVGHSDGADVALMTAYEQGTGDERVRAVVADAPDPIGRPTSSSSDPLLLIQGTADSVVPYSASQSVYRQVPAPVYYLSLIGADHLPPIEGGTPWTASLDSAVVNFLDATIAGRTSPTALTGQLSALPLSTLEARSAGDAVPPPVP
jgi:dienelactone hydrolase